MESQADILECTAGAQSGRRAVTVCFSPMSMLLCNHGPRSRHQRVVCMSVTGPETGQEEAKKH